MDFLSIFWLFFIISGVTNGLFINLLAVFHYLIGTTRYSPKNAGNGTA
jgi:hypothetical protein